MFLKKDKTHSENLKLPETPGLQKNTLPFWGVWIVIALLLGGMGGYYLRLNHGSQPTHITTLLPNGQPTIGSIPQGSLSLLQDSAKSPSPYISGAITGVPVAVHGTPTGPLNIDADCLTGDYDAQTAEWKAYTNILHHYSFKYPPGNADIFTNEHMNGSGDYSDTVYHIDAPFKAYKNPAIPIFGLTVMTATRWPYQINRYNEERNAVINGGGTYIYPNNISPLYSVTQGAFLNQQTLFFKSLAPGATTTDFLKFIRDGILYDHIGYKAACLILRSSLNVQIHPIKKSPRPAVLSSNEWATA